MNLAELTLLIYVANTAGFTNHGPHKCSQGIQLNMPLKVSCFFHLNWMRNWSHHPHRHQPPSSTYQLSIYYCNPLLTLLGYPTSPFGKSPKNRKKKQNPWRPGDRPDLQPGNAFLQLLSSPASSWISCFSALRSICLPRIADSENPGSPRAAPLTTKKLLQLQ